MTDNVLFGTFVAYCFPGWAVLFLVWRYFATPRASLFEVMTLCLRNLTWRMFMLRLLTCHFLVCLSTFLWINGIHCGWFIITSHNIFLMASVYLAAVVALSSINSGSICNFMERLASNRPTTILSRIISSRRGPYSQCSARQCNEVIKESMLSPLSCRLWLNLAH